MCLLRSTLRGCAGNSWFLGDAKEPGFGENEALPWLRAEPCPASSSKAMPRWGVFPGILRATPNVTNFGGQEGGGGLVMLLRSGELQKAESRGHCGQGSSLSEEENQRLEVIQSWLFSSA